MMLRSLPFHCLNAIFSFKVSPVSKNQQIVIFIYYFALLIFLHNKSQRDADSLTTDNEDNDKFCTNLAIIPWIVAVSYTANDCPLRLLEPALSDRQPEWLCKPRR